MVLALASLAWLVPRPSLADLVDVHVSADEESAEVVLAWPEPIDFKATVAGRDLLIAFARPIEAPSLSDLAEGTGGLLAGATVRRDGPSERRRNGRAGTPQEDGQDQGEQDQDAQDRVEADLPRQGKVLLRASRDVRYSVRGRGKDVVIEVAADQGEATPPPETPEARLQIDLARADAMVEAGDEEGALELLRQLEAKYPEDEEVLAALAEVEQQIGHWRRALALWERAIAIQPYDYFISSRDQILREQGTEGSIDSEWVYSSDQQEWISTTEARTLVADGVRVGFQYQVDYVLSAQDVQRSDGGFENFDGTRHRGEFYGQFDDLDGRSVRGSVFAGRGTAGGGVNLTAPYLRGTTELVLEYNRPNWDFIEGVVRNGARDRVGIKRVQRFTNRLDATLGVSGNRYGINNVSNAMKTIEVEADLSYQILDGPPYLILIYGLDALYRTDIEKRVDADGETFEFFPIDQREVHSAIAAFGSEYENNLSWDAFAGVSADRFGGLGPFAGVEVNYEPPGNLTYQLRAETSLDPDNTDDSEVTLGGRIAAVF